MKEAQVDHVAHEATALAVRVQMIDGEARTDSVGIRRIAQRRGEIDDAVFPRIIPRLRAVRYPKR